MENSEEQRRKLMREVEALTGKLEEARASADKFEKSKKKLQAEVGTFMVLIFMVCQQHAFSMVQKLTNTWYPLFSLE